MRIVAKTELGWIHQRLLTIYNCSKLTDGLEKHGARRSIRAL